ncbi:MAG: peptidase T [candidate division KSB1 bacterium]|nr:peptidase T [candidate division KSB1 bacterium]
MKDQDYTCVERFLKYITFDTQSSEESDTVPSTEKQKKLGKVLVEELKEMGLQDAHMDNNGYVMASLAGNVDHAVPAIGLIAHLDTSPDVSGKDVKAVTHENYSGGDIKLKDGVVIPEGENPELARNKGSNIITSDGTTLLGADNKAGIAEIFDAVQVLLDHPEIKHGDIKIAVTPDEEIGKGADHFDIEKFGADYAYTIDGESAGEIEDETFCADAVNMTITGVNVHPGYAKNRLINAVKIASEIINLLPKDSMSPETTEDREGYVHPHVMQGNVETASIKWLIRDFTVEGLKEKEAYLKKLSDDVMSSYPQARMNFEVQEFYRNMKYKLNEEPRVVDYALEAVERAGIKSIRNLIRGGTDGARLSYEGLLTPNVFTGGHNFHSRQEWISVKDMKKAVDVILNLVQIWAEKSK